jgi:hypothetical protein
MLVVKLMCLDEIYASVVFDRPLGQRFKKSKFGQLQPLSNLT